MGATIYRYSRNYNSPLLFYAGPTISETLENDIKGHYSHLIVRVVGKLRERNINVDDFRLYLTSHFGCGDFISSISSVPEIVEAVTRKQYWAYYNYYALEGIIKCFCKDDSEMIGWMKEYKTRLTAFKATTKIADYIKNCTDEELMDDADEALDDYQKLYDRKFYLKLSLKLRKSNDSIRRVDENCLSYIDELWTSVSDHFILPPLPIILEKIRDGCIEITLIVPDTIAHIINLMATSPGSTKFCWQRNIMCIMVDDKAVYNEDKAVYNAVYDNDEVDKAFDIPIADAIKVLLFKFGNKYGKSC